MGKSRVSCFFTRVVVVAMYGHVPMQSAFSERLLRHKQRLHRRVEHKKWWWIESAYAKPTCLLYFFPYQFPVTGNQAMWLLSE